METITTELQSFDELPPLRRLCQGEPQALEVGHHVGILRSFYDSIPAFSSTVLRKWLALETIPSEFAWWLENRWSEPLSDSKLLGSALDCMLLEPQEFAHKFAVLPYNAPPRPSSRTRQAKNPSPASLAAMAYWDEFNGSAAGKQILTAAQNTSCLEMMLAMRKARCVEGVFEHCQKTVFIGKLFGFPAKGEIDLWNPRIPHILELKTAVDVSRHAFARAIISFAYIEQAAFYLQLARACGFEDKRIFSWITIKNEAPWTVKVHNFAPFEDPDHFILFEAAQRRLARAARALARRLEANDFSDSQDWELVTFQEWTLRQAKIETLMPV
jgi:PDDEXK-like uncharacterized protein DUF3799